MSQTLEKMFHSLPDVLMNIIRDYARERTPQERMARLHLHFIKIKSRNKLERSRSDPQTQGVLKKYFFKERNTYSNLLLNIHKYYLLRQIKIDPEQEYLFTLSNVRLTRSTATIADSVVIMYKEPRRLYIFGKVDEKPYDMDHTDDTGIYWDRELRKCLHQEAREFALQYRG
jgi:hypothetical protein